VAKSIEPVCIFMIGLMIAVSVVALFLPVLKLVQAL
jgi:type II secretory pathway component PulF